MIEKENNGHPVSGTTEDIGGTLKSHSDTREITRDQWLEYGEKCGYDSEYAQKLLRKFSKEPWVSNSDWTCGKKMTQANSGFNRFDMQGDRRFESSRKNGTQGGRPPKGKK